MKKAISGAIQGALVGTTLAIQFGWIWHVAAVIGGFVGYIAYDWNESWEATKTAWRAIKNEFRVIGYIASDVLGFIVFTLSVIWVCLCGSLNEALQIIGPAHKGYLNIYLHMPAWPEFVMRLSDAAEISAGLCLFVFFSRTFFWYMLPYERIRKYPDENLFREQKSATNDRFRFWTKATLITLFNPLCVPFTVRIAMWMLALLLTFLTISLVVSTPALVLLTIAKTMRLVYKEERLVSAIGAVVGTYVGASEYSYFAAMFSSGIVAATSSAFSPTRTIATVCEALAACYLSILPSSLWFDVRGDTIAH